MAIGALEPNGGIFIGMMMSSVTAEAEGLLSTLELAANGDEIAFARLVAEHHADMARIAYLVCGDLTVAEEAEQAAWAHVWRRLREVRDTTRLRAWLMTIAANEARQIMRSQRRRTVRELAVMPHGEPAVPDRSELIDLSNALTRLEPRDRAIVGLRYMAGLDSTEIGRALGMSPSGVRVRLTRVLDRLREELRDG